jgi:hypothetical protein
VKKLKVKDTKESQEILDVLTKLEEEIQKIEDKKVKQGLMADWRGVKTRLDAKIKKQKKNADEKIDSRLQKILEKRDPKFDFNDNSNDPLEGVKSHAHKKGIAIKDLACGLDDFKCTIDRLLLSDLQYIEERSKSKNDDGIQMETLPDGTGVDDEITKEKFEHWIEFIMKQKDPSNDNGKIYKYGVNTYFEWFKAAVDSNEKLLKMYTEPKPSEDSKEADTKRRAELSNTLLQLFKKMYLSISVKKEEENNEKGKTSIFKGNLKTKNKQITYDGKELKAMKKSIESFLEGVKYKEAHEYSSDEEF